MKSNPKVVLKTLLFMSLWCASASVFAGENITTQNGLLSNLTAQDPSVVYVDIYPPELGKWYVVKANFFKTETSAEAVDAYFDYLNSQKEETGEKGSALWNITRESFKEVESHASLEVLDVEGNSIGAVSNLGLITWRKKVKFKATDSHYQVKLSCSQGAGLYHLVFEYK